MRSIVCRFDCDATIGETERKKPFDHENAADGMADPTFEHRKWGNVP